MNQTAGPQIDFDPDALREKYREERDKRLRPDGNDQYLQIKGQLAHYLEDPYTPVVERAPKTDHVTFAFIGGGFAGLATAARLTEAGYQRFLADYEETGVRHALIARLVDVLSSEASITER